MIQPPARLFSLVCTFESTMSTGGITVLPRHSSDYPQIYPNWNCPTLNTLFGRHTLGLLYDTCGIAHENRVRGIESFRRTRLEHEILTLQFGTYPTWRNSEDTVLALRIMSPVCVQSTVGFPQRGSVPILILRRSTSVLANYYLNCRVALFCYMSFCAFFDPSQPITEYRILSNKDLSKVGHHHFWQSTFKVDTQLYDHWAAQISKP